MQWIERECRHSENRTVFRAGRKGFSIPYCPRVWSDFYVKFGVRNLHTVPLDIRAFRDIGAVKASLLWTQTR